MNPNSPITLVQKRNLEKPESVYHFKMYKHEFDSQDPIRNVPDLEPGVSVIKISD
jgi:hypothetical protein